MNKILSILCFLILLGGTGFTHDNGSVQVKVLAKSVTSWNGKALQSYAEGAPEVTILRIVIPPKTKLPLHTHPVINAGVLLKGELTVKTADNDTLQMKAGDAIVEVVNTWHYGENRGDVPAEIIVFYAGVVEMPITVKERKK